MGRYTGPNCRLCRREGTRLFLKGDKCNSQACTLNKKQAAPGKLTKFNKKPTEYAIQLREKQKVKRYYGVLEKQFRRYFEMASRHKGVTGEVLLQILERRLDNLVYKTGFAPSIKAARQLVLHGHFQVNGKKMSIPSYVVKLGEQVSVCEASKTADVIVRSVEGANSRQIPGWLDVDLKKLVFTVKELPARTELQTGIEINEQLIVELYSK
jgi:small subunit ribosomal protein S4